jgi:AmmeMemoRadiSam system protein B
MFYKKRLIHAIGVMCMLSLNSNAADGAVRQPAVAGQFYPDRTDSLKSEVGLFMANGPKTSSYPVMLISPHAGYVFSGPVAGKGYSTIRKNIKTIIIIGPSHHEWFSGLCITDVDYYQTPLGKVPLNKEIILKLRKSPLVHAVRQADEPEHSLEVQVPFLQEALTSFSIVPIVTGKVDPAEAADLICPFVNETTLIVASSDLSHYHSSPEAKAIDAKTIGTILSGNVDGFIDACGETAIRIVMRCAAKLNLSPELLDARNSFETAPQYGSSDRVVGYASIVYLKKIK